MGVNAGLWIVPAEEFVPRDGGLVRPRLPKGGTWFDLDKAWSEFDEVLRDLPPPLDRTIGGDVWPEGSLYEDNGNDDATWLGFVSPLTVVEIAKALDRISPGEMVELIAAAGCLKVRDDFGQQYYAEYFERLRLAYRTAAAAGAGLGVLLC